MFLRCRLLFRSSFVAKMSENIKRAQRVQADIEGNKYAIEHQAKIRQKVTVESSIEALENEMREEIARALKNSESKVIYLIKKAEKRKKSVTQVGRRQRESKWEKIRHRSTINSYLSVKRHVGSSWCIVKQLVSLSATMNWSPLFTKSLLRQHMSDHN